MDWLQVIHPAAGGASPATFGPGADVRVWYRILEQGKERLGQFEGTVIRCRGAGPSRTFTVRRVTYGEGVERVFPLDSKTVSRIEVLREGRVRRSRLYFLRRTIGKTRLATLETPAGDPSSGAALLTNIGADAEPSREKSESAVVAGGKPAAGVPPQS